MPHPCGLNSTLPYVFGYKTEAIRCFPLINNPKNLDLSFKGSKFLGLFWKEEKNIIQPNKYRILFAPVTGRFKLNIED